MRQIFVYLSPVVFLMSIAAMYAISPVLTLFATFIPLQIFALYLLYVYFTGPIIAAEGDLERAIAHYTRMLRLPGNRAFLYRQRAKLHQQTGAFETAWQDIDEAVKRRPLDPEMRQEHAVLALTTQRYEQALEDAHALLGEASFLCAALTLRARALMHMNQWESALAAADAALACAPAEQQASLHVLRATVHALSGDNNAAMADFNLARARKPSAEVLASIDSGQAMLYLLKGDLDHAAHYFDAARRSSDDHIPALAGLALVLHLRGDVERALALWSHLLDQDTAYSDPQRVRHALSWPPQLIESLWTRLASA